jgi:hypothetical protein
MALELYANYWLTASSRPKPQVASWHLSEALFLCEQWGATTKTQRMRTTYASVLASNNGFYTAGPPESEQIKKVTDVSGFSLDLETSIQMAQTISNEVCLKKKKSGRGGRQQILENLHHISTEIPSCLFYVI